MEHILFKHPDKNNFMYSKKNCRGQQDTALSVEEDNDGKI